MKNNKGKATVETNNDKDIAQDFCKIQLGAAPGMWRLTGARCIIGQMDKVCRGEEQGDKRSRATVS